MDDSTVHDDLQGFLAWLTVQGRSPATARAYAAEVRRAAAVGAAAYVGDERMAPATRRRRYQALRAHGIYTGVMPDLPRPEGTVHRRVVGDAVPLPAVRAGRDTPPAGRHFTTFRRDRACALLCLASGLSVGQLADLALGDVSVHDGRAWLYLGERQIPLAGAVRRALLDYLMVRGEPLDPDSPLFLSRQGGPLPYRTLQSGVARFLSDGGTPAGAANGRAARRAFLTALLAERGGLAIGVDLLGLSPAAVARYAPPRRGGAAVLDKVASGLTARGTAASRNSLP